jgi:hypothetical protein
VPATTGNKTFSFFGITRGLNESLIGSVRIVTGTDALGPIESATVDLVVMDDFLYGEPVPQPSSAQLLGLPLLEVAAMSRSRRARATR